jgi:hypothetical protein
MHTHISCDRFVPFRRLALLVLAVWSLSSLGCAGPFAPGIADYETKRDVEKAAADTAIPSALEVGLDGDEASPAEKPAAGTSAAIDKPAAATLDDDKSADPQTAPKAPAAKKSAGSASVTDEH